MLTFDGAWHIGGVFSSWMIPSLHCSGQMADNMCDNVCGVVCVSRFLMSVFVDQVVHCSGGVMLGAGVCYGRRAQVHFIDGISDAQSYRDEILRPILVPHIQEHHLILQQDNAWPQCCKDLY